MTSLSEALDRELLKAAMDREIGSIQQPEIQLPPQINMSAADFSSLEPMAAHREVRSTIPIKQQQTPVGILEGRTIQSLGEMVPSVPSGTFPTTMGPFGTIPGALPETAVNLGLGLGRMTLDLPQFVGQVAAEPQILKDMPSQIVEPAAKLAAAATVAGESPQADKFARETFKESVEHPEAVAMPLLVASGITKPLARVATKLGRFRGPSEISGVTVDPFFESQVIESTPRTIPGEYGVETPLSKFMKSPEAREVADIGYDPVINEIKEMTSNALRDELIDLGYKPSDIGRMNRNELEFNVSGGRIPIKTDISRAPQLKKIDRAFPEEAVSAKAGGGITRPPGGVAPAITKTVEKPPVSAAVKRGVGEPSENAPVEFGQVVEMEKPTRTGRMFTIEGEAARIAVEKQGWKKPTFGSREEAQSFINTLHEQRRRQKLKAGEIEGMPSPLKTEEIIKPTPESTPQSLKMQKEPIIKKRKIVEKLSKSLDIPIRTGGSNFMAMGRKFLGWYNRWTKGIRTRYPKDLRTTGHEIGHHIFYELKLKDAIDKNTGFQGELARMGQDLYGQAGIKLSPESALSEGMAEFVSIYLNSPEAAKSMAPEYFKTFETTLAKEHPEVFDLLKDTQADIKRWNNQSNLAKVFSNLSVGEKSRLRFDVNKLYSWILDDTHFIGLAEKDLTGAIGKDITSSPKKAAELFRGQTGKAMAWIKDGIRDKDFNKIGPSLEEVIKPIADNIDDFRAYTIAKRSLELNKRKIFTGISESEANGALAEISRLKLDEVFDKTQKELIKWQDYGIDNLVDAGVIDRDIAAYFRKMNKEYVPFFRLSEKTTKSPKGRAKGFGNIEKPIMEIEGGGYDIVDPLESIVKNTFTFINIAERNRVGLKIADLSKLEGSAGWVDKVDVPVKPVEIKLGEKPIRETIESFGLELPDEAVGAIARVFRPVQVPSKWSNVMSVWRDGKLEFYELHPDLYEAVLSLDRESSNILVDILATPAKLLRAGATLTPEFMIRNPLRDVMSAGLYAGTNPLKFARGLFHALKKDDLYWKWQSSGGANATLVSMDRSYLQKALREMTLDRWPRKAWMRAKHPIETLRDISEVTEQATRLAVFEKYAKKGGWTREAIMRAAAESRDATIDFGRKGTKTVNANKVTAFFNAALQGSDKLMRAHKNNPRGMIIKGLAYITVPTVLLYMKNRNNEKYKALPRWRRDMYWNIPIGDELYAVPKPFELGILYGSLFERALEYIDTQDPQVLTDLGRSAWDAGTPSIVPTALVPWVEAVANKNLFFDRPLVPEGQEGMEAYLQYGPTTSEAAKIASRAVSKVGIEIAPPVIENTVRGYTGGLGNRVLQGIDAALSVSGVTESEAEIAKTHPLQRVPGLQAFSVPDPGSQSRWVRKFYDELNQSQKAEKSYKRLLDLEHTEEAQKYFDKHQDEIMMAPALRKFNRDVAKMRTNLNKIMRGQATPEQRRKWLDEHYKTIEEIGKMLYEMKIKKPGLSPVTRR